jgi:succinate dehydrogenase (ubiquinone) cytochrome b560 subunit
MEKTGRPVSPHVTIYAFPAGALTSITNRVTGVALSVGAAGISAVELMGGNGTAVQLLQDLTSMGPMVTSTVKFTVAFPFIYHFLGGVRHLLWDIYPQLLNNVDVKNASYILAGSSLALGIGVSLL